MSEGPDVTRIAAMIGERGRARILTALMAGRALTATELADAAGVTRPTASSHLSRLLNGKLIASESQGRHRYFRIANRGVAHALESLMGVAYRMDPHCTAHGPDDPAMRKARRCYDHLAGELGVLVYDSLESRGQLIFETGELALTDAGWRVFASVGIEASSLQNARRTVCRACLDWSERRHHLAGALGAAFMQRVLTLGWARQLRDSRVVRFSPSGERLLRSMFTPKGAAKKSLTDRVPAIPT